MVILILFVLFLQIRATSFVDVGPIPPQISLKTVCPICQDGIAALVAALPPNSIELY
jgi:hypothetical protein